MFTSFSATNLETREVSQWPWTRMMGVHDTGVRCALGCACERCEYRRAQVTELVHAIPFRIIRDPARLRPEEVLLLKGHQLISNSGRVGKIAEVHVDSAGHRALVQWKTGTYGTVVLSACLISSY